MPKPVITALLICAVADAGLLQAGCSQTDMYAPNPGIQVIDATAAPPPVKNSVGTPTVPAAPVKAHHHAGRTLQVPAPARTAPAPAPAPAAAPLLAAASPPPAPPARPAPSRPGTVMPYMPDDVLGNDLRTANLSAVRLGPEHYQVVMGDTLYSIAFRYGLDYRSLARRNNIDPPYNIRVGQILNLNLKGDRAPVYVVKKGDTLYSIAREQGQPLPFLAALNNLSEPYTLRVGQKLQLGRRRIEPHVPPPDRVIVAGSTTTARPITTTEANRVRTRAAEEKAKKEAEAKAKAAEEKAKKEAEATAKAAEEKARAAEAKAKKEAEARNRSGATAARAGSAGSAAATKVYSSATRKEGGITWSWPADGKVIAGFSLADHGNKGLDIAAARGSRVLSAADGEVVYAGNALRGYGNLVIVNHANEYLSAYAHNEELLVKEGQKVKRGQMLATMGSTDAQSVRLHFEIRYRGQSVNPTGYLPKTR